MIEVPRAVAGAFRAAVRRCGPRKGAAPFVSVRAGPGGLSLSSRLDGLWLRLDVPGPRPEEALAVSADALERLAGAAGVDPTTLPPFPEVPALTPASGCLLAALREATRTASRFAARFALHRVLMRGPEGLVVGGDGKVLLAWRVGPLPWDGDALVPRTDLWAWAGLPRDGVAVGRTGTHVFVRAGAWTAALDVDTATARRRSSRC